MDDFSSTASSFAVVAVEKDGKESRDNFAALLLSAAMILCFLSAYQLRARKFKYIHETGAFIIIGAVIGALIRFCGTLEQLQSVVTFDVEFFFVILLPPIIFESGYTMAQRPFFKNIDSILCFAFIGTLISSFSFAFVIYLFSYILGWTRLQMNFLECMIFGSFISATDPVTVLAIFKQLHVHPDLYSNVFGESVLNDAVAIVLYKTMLSFVGKNFSVQVMLAAIWQFIIILGSSVVLGCGVGVVGSLLFKHTKLFKYPILESALFVMYAYVSYMFSTTIGLSGIVNILFCGMVMSYYTYQNLSDAGKVLTVNASKLMAFISESFVFCYLGLAIFSFREEYDVILIGASIFACLLSRALNIVPLSALMNYIRPEARRIPPKHQFVLWFSGLRGAMAFALSLDATNTRGGTPVVPSAPYMMSTTLFLSLCMVLILGGCTESLVDRLGLRMRGDGGGGTVHPYSDPDTDTGGQQLEVCATDDDDDNNQQRLSFFKRIDHHYLRPFLIRRDNNNV